MPISALRANGSYCVNFVFMIFFSLSVRHTRDIAVVTHVSSERAQHRHVGMLIRRAYFVYSYLTAIIASVLRRAGQRPTPPSYFSDLASQNRNYTTYVNG